MTACERQPLPPLPGDLLVAGVGQTGGFFAGAVILLLESDDAGAAGVVLNAVAPVDLEWVLPGWESVVAPPQVAFRGGPVEAGGALCLGRRAPSIAAGDWEPLFADVGLVPLELPPAVVARDWSALRIFAGYSGWAPGQLAAELRRGDWYVVRGTPDDVFTAEPETLWRRVLRRSPGQAALLSTWTDHPELN